MSLLKLTVDRQNAKLVAYNGTPTELPPLFQYNLKAMQIQVVDPSGLLNSPFTVVDLNGYSLRVGIWPDPTGSAGGPSALALQTAWTWNSTNKYFTGSLDLATTAIETYIGSASSKSAWLEITTSLSGNRTTLFQGQITLRAVGDEGTAVALTPGDVYYNQAESNARFVPRVMENGGTIVIPSPSGVYAVELGCNDDGTLKANVITL